MTFLLFLNTSLINKTLFIIKEILAELVDRILSFPVIDSIFTVSLTAFIRSLISPISILSLKLLVVPIKKHLQNYNEIGKAVFKICVNKYRDPSSISAYLYI